LTHTRMMSSEEIWVTKYTKTMHGWRFV